MGSALSERTVQLDNMLAPKEFKEDLITTATTVIRICPVTMDQMYRVAKLINEIAEENIEILQQTKNKEAKR